MIDVVEAAKSAEVIGLPKGADNRACIGAFQELTGIEVPYPDGRKLSAESQGRQFYFLKGKDMPGIVSSNRTAVDVGVTGIDSLIESGGYFAGSNLESLETGDVMCRFAVLAKEAEAERLIDRLASDDRRPSMVVTSFPRLLGFTAAVRDLNLIPVTDVRISGSGEIMTDVFRGIPLEADIVEDGATAAANGRRPIANLLDIRPVVIARDEMAPVPELARTYEGVDLIDAALRQRYIQAQDPSVEPTGTIRYFRDANARQKKMGEEEKEYIVASIAGTPEQQLSELADEFFWKLVDLTANSGGRLGLGNVLDVLSERNTRMTAIGRLG